MSPLRIAVLLAAALSLAACHAHYHPHVPPGQVKKVVAPPPGQVKKMHRY